MNKNLILSLCASALLAPALAHAFVGNAVRGAADVAGNTVRGAGDIAGAAVQGAGNVAGRAIDTTSDVITGRHYNEPSYQDNGIAYGPEYPVSYEESMMEPGMTEDDQEEMFMGNEEAPYENEARESRRMEHTMDSRESERGMREDQARARTMGTQAE